MAHSVRYSTRALASLSQFEGYLSERNPAGAANVLADIKRSIELVAIFPSMGTTIADLNLRYHLTRRYQYLIVYRVADTAIEIRDVLHPRQRGRT